MNLQQKKIAHILNSHFIRERNLMPRQFSVILFTRDLEYTIEDFSSMFSEHNESFDRDKFKEICLRDV